MIYYSHARNWGDTILETSLMSNEKKSKTRTASFRILEHILSDVEKEAKTQLISTNSLINRILLQYVQWDKYENRMKMFPVPEESLQHILEHIDEIKRNEAVEIIYNSIRDWTLISKKKFDIHSVLEVLEDYCRMVDISIEDTVSSGYRSYIIRHNLGRSVSLLVSDLVKKIFYDSLKMKVNINLTNTTVVAKLTSKFD